MGQRNGVRVVSHVISKCFSHLHCTLPHHLSIWQVLLCLSELEWSSIILPESRLLCSCGSGKKNKRLCCLCFFPFPLWSVTIATLAALAYFSYLSLSVVMKWQLKSKSLWILDIVSRHPKHIGLPLNSVKRSSVLAAHVSLSLAAVEEIAETSCPCLL